MTPEFPEVEVQLSGEDGNVYHIIGSVYEALREQNLYKEAQQFKRVAFQAGSYDAVLQLAMRTVTVK